jgi:hypothetical protein
MSGKLPIDPEMFENNEELGALKRAADLHFPPEMVSNLLLAALTLKEPARKPGIPAPGTIRLPTGDPDRSMWIIVGPGEEEPEVCPTCGRPWHQAAP